MIAGTERPVSSKNDERLSGDLAAAALAIARRLAAGATIWCVSTRWPSHASHVAVEFVHPVIVGKRALPAAAVAGSDLDGSLRRLVRPGDVLLVIAPADCHTVTDLLRRAGAWGLTSLWIGAGTRSTRDLADLTVWVDDVAADVAARSGHLVRCYHLLWELTHVVLEHPGLLEDAAGADPGGERCITCSDAAQVAEVQAVGEGTSIEVLVGGRSEVVDATLVEPLCVGDLLLVHAGVALSALGPQTREGAG
jgi:hydrogenase maturation factor